MELEIVSLKGELKRLAIANKKQSKEITMLMDHLEDAKIDKEELKNNLQRKGHEIKIVHQRLNKKRFINLKFNKSSSDLEKLLNI